MNIVAVKKEELLGYLRDNRILHMAIYNDALEGYREEAIKLLEKSLEDAKNGGEIVIQFKLNKPISYLKEYDKAILMMKMSVDDVITLSDQEFSQYIMDEWSWSNNFLMSNMQYTKIK